MKQTTLLLILLFLSACSTSKDHTTPSADKSTWGRGTGVSGSGIPGAKKHSKDEINSMVKDGKHPKLGEAKPSITPRDFEACKENASSIKNMFEKRGWPAKVLVDQKDIYQIESWSTDSKVMYKCENGNQIALTEPYIE